MKARNLGEIVQFESETIHRVTEHGAPGAYGEIDDVRLVRSLELPQLAPSTLAQDFRLTFSGMPGLRYKLETLVEGTWSSSGLPTFIGVGPHNHVKPIAHGSELFRVFTDRVFMDVSFAP